MRWNATDTVLDEVAVPTGKHKKSQLFLLSRIFCHVEPGDDLGLAPFLLPRQHA